MVPKSSLFIRIVAGAYVIYLGEKLINSSLADKPENYILYIAAGNIRIDWSLLAGRIRNQDGEKGIPGRQH